MSISVPDWPWSNARNPTIPAHCWIRTSLDNGPLLLPSPKSQPLALLLNPSCPLHATFSFLDSSILPAHTHSSLLPLHSSHSFTNTRSSWRCTVVTKIPSKAASQAQQTACTHQIRLHSKPPTDVVPSRRQAIPVVTISAPLPGTLSTQPLWAPLKTLRPFTSTIKSKTKNISVLDV